MNKSMDNVKEISSIRRTNSNISDARERFRHLNASHRSAGRVQYKTYKNNNYENYVENEDAFVDKDLITEKANKNFRRLMVSTGLVAFVLVVKLMDNSFTNGIEERMTSLIRNTSELDDKISNTMVSLTEKVGININGMSSEESSNGDNTQNTQTDEIMGGTATESSETADSLVEKDSENATSDIDANTIDEVESSLEPTESETISQDQVADFYIDDSVFEEIKGDSKK